MLMEIKVTIEAPELASAINNLAAALMKKGRIEPVIAVEEPQVSKNPAPNATSPAEEKVAPNVAPPSVPIASAPQYTVEQIMKAGAALMDAGKINELRNLISSFGVDAVTNLKQEQLGAFATELRKLGAKI